MARRLDIRADAFMHVESVLRRLQRLGPTQFAIEIENGGGKIPTARFRIADQSDILDISPATDEADTLIIVVRQAFELWSPDSCNLVVGRR